MRNKKNILLLIFIIISFLGCNNNSNKTNSELYKSDAEQHLSIALGGEPKTFDQAKGVDQYSSQIIFEINEALTRAEVDENGKNIVKPAGAESWEISSDGLKWTFHLRENKWSDGKKVTAADYEYGIKRNLDPQIKSQKSFLLYPIKGARDYNEMEKNKAEKVLLNKVGVKALDDKTLEIELENPCPYFLNLTNYEIMQPQRKDLIEKFGDKYGNECNTMAFNGPFSISKWDHNEKIELVKNKFYWDAKSVKLEKIMMKIEKNDTKALSGLLNGSLDVVKDLNLEYSKKIEKEEKINTLKVPDTSINFEVYNQNSKLFSNFKVRKAFTLAIDREEISKNLWKEIYTPAYSWIPPYIQIGDNYFRNKTEQEPIKNMKSENTYAKKLLIEGLEELGMDTDPSKITISYLQAGTDIGQKNIAEFFQKMYNKNLGINVKVEYVDYDSFSKKISLGEYQLASLTWKGDYNDPSAYLNLWMKNINFISTGWSNPDYDSLIKKSSGIESLKSEERLTNFKEAENMLLLKNAVISPTVYRNKQISKKEYVKGIMTPIFGPDIEFKYAYTKGRN